MTAGEPDEFVRQGLFLFFRGLLTVGDWDRTIAEYTAALREDPNNARAYYSRGNASGNKGDYDRAIADFNQAIRLDPNYAYAYNNCGFAYRNRNDYDRAIADYTQAIRLDTNDAAYNSCGSAYSGKRDYDRAIADYSFGKKDIVIGDRAYRGKQGIEYLVGKQGGFLFRFGTNRFHVYNRQGRRVNVLGYFKGLKPGESGEKTLWYKYEGEYKPLRFCVVRKTKKAEERGLETLRKTRMRKYGDNEVSEAQRAYNRYVIVVTSITDAAPEVILDLYRQRWQIEMAFKR
ncbi:MAG: tetratricopeptide repeat protein, partial [Treponema sp.]|nr:tetratricopeptide repeat protein [Treponema sp.]